MLFNASYTTILNTAIADVTSVLTTFAADPLFAEKFALAFGKTVSSDQFLQSVAALPQIEVRSDAELKGALGAFSAQTQKIYLSESLLKGDSARLRSVLMEEIGHFVDTQVNGVDSPGDEGAIFAAVVLGQDLPPSQLAQLKSEDDHGVISLNGEVIAVEQATAKTWANSVDGVWNDANNWVNGEVPGTGDDVVISFADADITTTFQSGSLSLNSLQSDEAFVISGGTLDLSGIGGEISNLTFSGGELTGTGDVVVNNNFD